MVYVPGGEFTLGMNTAEQYANCEKFFYSCNPGEFSIDTTRTVKLDSFWIDQMEVTYAQFAKCVEAGICELTNGQATRCVTLGNCDMTKLADGWSASIKPEYLVIRWSMSIGWTLKGIATGLAQGFLLLQNGKLPRVVRMDGSIPGEMKALIKRCSITIIREIQQWWAATRKEPALTAPWIWLAMCPSGYLTGIQMIITYWLIRIIHRERRQANTVSCAEAPGSIGMLMLLYPYSQFTDRRITTSFMDSGALPEPNRT